ncbi:hypothetical protein UFOVP81_36 [uncultured Caudovirales phage]|uniref:Uncharacterized protein n=1 Tax=uncultured Caudovirales phage TaxID=2100421 RepID=A0A6J5L0W4_9CAUD|nr:hypothetical protein UFOVP81_36 [uncultured Caudovirales phage]
MFYYCRTVTHDSDPDVFSKYYIYYFKHLDQGGLLITPYYSIGSHSSSLIQPTIFWDFTASETLDARITHTRSGNTATRTNPSGVIEIVSANTPRFDYNPSTSASLGIMTEDTKTNKLLSSLIDGTNLSTQDVTVTAVSHALSFYGGGSITLSGAYTAVLMGRGFYPNRNYLVFTPTAGTLTCTVSGTVQYAQLEIGATPTSFIPTDATTKTRNADSYSVTGTNFSNFFNPSEGTLIVEAQNTVASYTGTQMFAGIYDVSALTNSMYLDFNAGSGRYVKRIAGTASVYTKAWTANTINRLGGTYKSGTAGIGSVNGSNGSVATGVGSGFVLLTLGDPNYSNNGHVRKFWYYPQSLSAEELNKRTKYA